MSLNLKVLALLAYGRALNRAIPRFDPLAGRLPLWINEYRRNSCNVNLHHWSFHFYMDDLNHNTPHHNTRR